MSTLGLRRRRRYLKARDQSRSTTAFVLSGGGSLAAAHVGMLQALAARGIRPDVLIGSSAGALNAAFVAGGEDPDETLTELAEIWQSLAQQDVSPFGPHRRLLVNGSHPSLCSPNGLANLVIRRLRYERLEDARLPVHVVGADLRGGQERLISTGPVTSALRAAAAAPAILPTTHLGHAAAVGASRVFLLPAWAACSRSKPLRSPLDDAIHDVSHQIAQRSLLEVAAHCDHVELLVVPPLRPQDVAPTDFRHGGEMVERARQATLGWLDRGCLDPPPQDALSLRCHSGAGAGLHRRPAA